MTARHALNNHAAGLSAAYWDLINPMGSKGSTRAESLAFQADMKLCAGESP